MEKKDASLDVPFQQPYMQLAIMSRGYVVSRAIQAIASLGIADYMSDDPIPVKTIAELTATHPELLNRLLYFLSAYGLFTRKDDAYALTALSKPLRADDPHSIKDVLNMVDSCWWQAFAHLDNSLKTGIPPFEQEHGTDFFDFLSQHPQKQANFDKGMAKLSTYDDEVIAKAYNFGELENLIDVGGGRGGLAKAIAKYHADLKITLFETPAVIDQLSSTNFPVNITFQKGDFFAELPEAEGYLFKGVLHDFNDKQVQKILTNCHSYMPKKSTLIIAEQIIPDSDAPHPNKTMDIVMMVLLGGRQRTLTDWKALVEPAGFVFDDSYPTESIFTVLKFKPVG